MNEPGQLPPDWESVFHQARRRIFGRLLLVGVLAAIGTTLLLGGGLSAQGAVSIGPIGKNGKDEPDPVPAKAKRPDDPDEGRYGDGTGNSDPATRPENRDRKPSNMEKSRDKDKSEDRREQVDPCDDSTAGTQYCDAAPPEPTKDDESGAAAVAPAD